MSAVHARSPCIHNVRSDVINIDAINFLNETPEDTGKHKKVGSCFVLTKLVILYLKWSKSIKFKTFAVLDTNSLKFLYATPEVSRKKSFPLN